MGNINSGADGRRRHSRRRSNTHPTAAPPPPPPPPAHPPQQPPPATEIPANRIVFAAATPYPNPNPNQFYHQYPGYYPPPPGAMPVSLPTSYEQYHHQSHYPHNPIPYPHIQPWTGAGRYACGPMMPQPLPCVEHQQAVTIRNDVNLKKETLKLEPDPDCPGRFLVSFTFDATVSGRITVIFFAEESEKCNLTATKEDILPPITMEFEKGLAQKFKQPSGSGIDFTVFEDAELFKAADTDIYPLAVKAEAGPSGDDEEARMGSKNAQITQAVYEKDKGEIKIRVVKQILWVNEERYELQEIYGIGNTAAGDEDSADDANDPGKECVICLSEPRDTTVLPCRHMCMCSGCAKVLRFQTNRCPICRQLVERLLEIKVHGNSGDGNSSEQGGTAEQE